MAARLTLSLVLLAAAMLMFGYVSHTAWLIYVSIACSALAATFLLISSRQRRARPEPELDMAWPASLAEPSDAEPSRRLPGPAVDVSGRRVDGDSFSAAPAKEAAAASRLTRSPAATSIRTIPSPALSRVADFETQPFLEPEPEPVSGVSIFSGRPSAGTKAPKRSPIAADWLQRTPPQHMSVRSQRAQADGGPFGAAAKKSAAKASAPRPVVAIKPVAAIRPDLKPVAAVRPPDPTPSAPATRPIVETAAARSSSSAMQPAPALTAPVPAAVRPHPQPVPQPSRQPAPQPSTQLSTEATRPPVPAVRSAPPSGPAVGTRPAPRPAPVPPAQKNGPAPRPAAQRRVAATEDYPFPIEDYEYLESDEILPLLSELDDDELVEVLLFELDGPKRADVLNRIDALLEGEDWS